MPLAEANINVDMIVQNVSGRRQDHRPHLHGAGRRLSARARRHHQGQAAIGYKRLDSATDVAKISVIGIGMRSHAGVAAQAFRALAERAVNIRAITTSEIKFSLLIDAAFTELAVRTLHSLYDLDQAAPNRLPTAATLRRPARLAVSIFSLRRRLTLAAAHKFRRRHRGVFGLQFACRIRYRLQGDRRGPGPGVFLFG